MNRIRLKAGLRNSILFIVWSNSFVPSVVSSSGRGGMESPVSWSSIWPLGAGSHHFSLLVRIIFLSPYTAFLSSPATSPVMLRIREVKGRGQLTHENRVLLKQIKQWNSLRKYSNPKSNSKANLPHFSYLIVINCSSHQGHFEHFERSLERPKKSRNFKMTKK